jgi:hypothetical protein
MDWWVALFVLFVLTFGGWVVVGLTLLAVRKSTFGRRQEVKECFGALELWLGSTERLVAAALVAIGSPHLSAFIGAWIALKLAANWQRIKSDKDEVRKGHLIALIGSVLSFTIAILVGLYINPGALAHIK